MLHARRIPTGPVVLVAVVLLWGAGTLTLCLGQPTFPISDVYSVIAHRGLHLPVTEPTEYPSLGLHVWIYRFPRVALAACAGAGLAVAGVAAQALVRNALADPFVLGVSSGASCGAIAAAALGLGTGGAVVQGGAAIVGALAALLLVMAVATRSGETSPMRLVLAGLAIAYTLSGVTGFMIMRYLGGSAESVAFVLTGNLGNARLNEQWLPVAALVIGLILVAFDAGRLNAFVLGDETAAGLGIHVTRLRLRLIFCIALLTGVMVAQAGVIGFVGLVVPHFARLLVGPNHRRVLPVSAALGAAYLVGCDYIAYTAVYPNLLPVGVVAGGVGAPVFLWLLLGSRRARRA